jgi:hypothetical protein
MTTTSGFVGGISKSGCTAKLTSQERHLNQRDKKLKEAKLDRRKFMNENQVTWWAPEGFSQSSSPAEYASIEKDGDWDELLRKAGYEEIAEYGDISPRLER